MKKFLLLNTLIFIFHFAFPTQIFAATTTSTKTAAVVSGSPKISLTMVTKPRKSFVLTARAVKKVQYTIEYSRSVGKNKTQLEGLMGSGTAKNGIYSRTHFAGTQSTRYFLPHDVKSGTISLTGTDLKGKKFSYKAKFTVKNNKISVVTTK